MKKVTLAVLVSALMMNGSMITSAWADGPGGQPNPQWQQHQGEQQGRPDGRGNHNGNPRGPQGQGQDHGSRGNQGGPRGQGPQGHHEGDHFAWKGHDFRRGQPLPPAFRGERYQVNDWRGRGLPEPPQGAHWSYINGNYVLIAAATGVITSILLNGALHN